MRDSLGYLPTMPILGYRHTHVFLAINKQSKSEWLIRRHFSCIIRYTQWKEDMNGLYWCGSSLDDLRAFPKTAKISLGREIDRLERGALPSNYKPLKNLGKGITGVYEIRVRDKGNIYRTAYLAKIGAEIVILHCWQKKTPATAESDKKIIVKRYREFLESRR